MAAVKPVSPRITLQDDFSKGSWQDGPRDHTPNNAAYLLTNMIPNVPGGNTSPYGYAVRNRWGWKRTLDAMSASTSSYAAAVGFAPYSGGTRILGIDEDGRLYKWTPGSATTTDVGAAVVPAHSPVFYRNYAYIFAASGAATGYRYDNTTLSTISGSPPQGSVGCVFKDHLVTAHSSANPERVWFASAGDPTSWDTAADGQWLDCSGRVQGMAVLQNMILVFEEGRTERIRGDIIPGVVGSDMVREPLFNIGCSDPASIAVSNQYVVWGNATGIYMTDGLLPYDLTAQAGMSTTWRHSLGSYDSSDVFAGALYGDWYVFSVNVGAGGGILYAGAVNVKTKCWLKFTNFQPMMMDSAPLGVVDSGAGILFAEGGAPRISDATPMIDTSYGAVGYDTGLDGDGSAITATLETRGYPFSRDRVRWRDLAVTGSCGRPVTVQYGFVQEDTSYSSLGTFSSGFSVGGDSVLPVRKNLHYAHFKFSCTMATSTVFGINSIRAEITPKYGRRTN